MVGVSVRVRCKWVVAQSTMVAAAQYCDASQWTLADVTADAGTMPRAISCVFARAGRKHTMLVQRSVTRNGWRFFTKLLGKYTNPKDI